MRFLHRYFKTIIIIIISILIIILLQPDLWHLSYSGKGV